MNYVNIRPKPARLVLLPVVSWIAWFGINSFSLIYRWKETPKIPLVYEYCMLVVLFYIVHYCLKHYWISIMPAGKTITGWRQRCIHLFFRRQIGLLLLVIFLYLAGSWFADRYLFHMAHNDFLLYCDSRWVKAAPYVVVPAVYSYMKHNGQPAMQEMVPKAEAIKNTLLEEYIARNHAGQVDVLNELISRVDKITES